MSILKVQDKVTTALYPEHTAEGSTVITRFRDYHNTPQLPPGFSSIGTKSINVPMWTQQRSCWLLQKRRQGTSGGTQAGLEGSLVLRGNAPSLSIYAWHPQESSPRYQWCFKMLNKACSSHLFNLRRQHPYLQTNDSPSHSFPTRGHAVVSPRWDSSHAFHSAHTIHALVPLLLPMDKEMAVSRQSLLLVKSKAPEPPCQAAQALFCTHLKQLFQSLSLQTALTGALSTKETAESRKVPKIHPFKKANHYTIKLID